MPRMVRRQRWWKRSSTELGLLAVKNPVLCAIQKGGYHHSKGVPESSTIHLDWLYQRPWSGLWRRRRGPFCSLHTPVSAPGQRSCLQFLCQLGIRTDSLGCFPLQVWGGVCSARHGPGFCLWDGEYSDSTVVWAVWFISFVLAQRDDDCIPEVLWNCSFLPPACKEALNYWGGYSSMDMALLTRVLHSKSKISLEKCCIGLFYNNIIKSHLKNVILIEMLDSELSTVVTTLRLILADGAVIIINE